MGENPNRPVYDCDTSSYCCSEVDYNNSERKFGEFIENGRGYRIFDRNTPRPWLNYLANHKFGSVVSNIGLGFSWYRSTLLRITKYEHPVDYLPREFEDGREITVENPQTSQKLSLFEDADDLICIHRAGSTEFNASLFGVQFQIIIYVPVEDACENWIINISNQTENNIKLKIKCRQIWSFAKFGIHTAEEGIPYISIPGKNLLLSSDKKSVSCHSTNKELPYEMYGLFQSPEAESANFAELAESRRDGRKFKFHLCELSFSSDLNCGDEKRLNICSGADIREKDFLTLKNKYSESEKFDGEFKKLEILWDSRINDLSCEIPDKNLEYFMNIWFKNQLNLVYHFVRSGQNGYRDSLQDAWGFTLMNLENSKNRFIEILSHQWPNGTAPRNFSAFYDGVHDTRRFMDSPVWIPKTLEGIIREDGDFSFLNEEVLFLDSSEKASITEHVKRAMDYLFENRGQHKACLTGDGDWNDALEGISRDGDAVSVWLTIALYDAMKIMSELHEAAGDRKLSEYYTERCRILKEDVNSEAWDGEWYLYGFTGSGNPIGSKNNREGKIHANAQSWAVFSGIAEDKKAEKAMTSVKKYLDTPLGPSLMEPPYVNEADEVGRIANLEPGTFENASVYQHAVAFYIFAELAAGKYDDAFRTLVNLLPTNPENFDCRRTSEPYCTGNYYCGPDHKRFGQNFFTWFTGNAAWLLRAGFDEILGVKAHYKGLEIDPKVPESWKNFSVNRKFRGCEYNIDFIKGDKFSIEINGEKIKGNIIPSQNLKRAEVQVVF